MKKLLLILSILMTTQAFSVEHFAFFGDAMNGVGTGNYINQTKDISTMHFITAPVSSDQWRDKVSEAKKAGNKSVIMLEGLLFEWSSVKFNPNHQALLAELKQKLLGLEDSIIAVYLIDEPYFKNSIKTPPLSLEAVRTNLQEAALVAKSYFPNAKIIMTEAYPSFKTNFQLPAAVDWVGVNCYLSFGKVCSLDKVKEYNNALSLKLLPHQRLVFTLDAYWGNANATAPSVQTSIIDRTNEVLKIAQKYNAVAFIPFLYQTHVSKEEELHGANEMPLVMTYLKSIATKVKNKTFNYGNVCEAMEPRCEGRDYVRRNTCAKEIERWKNAPSPYCPAPGEVIPPKPGCVVMEPTCEGKDYVRRDSCGNAMEIWRNAPPPYCQK